MKRFKTTRPNIVYYEHSRRTHNGRPDRRFLLRYRHNGKQIEEAVGWASDGWNLTKANELLGEIRRNQRRAEGPQTLREKRELERLRIEAEAERKRQLAHDSVTFGEYFNDPYLPRAQRKKTRWTWKRELSLFNVWIEPVIGDLRLTEIEPAHVESIEETMEKAKPNSPPAPVNTWWPSCGRFSIMPDRTVSIKVKIQLTGFAKRRCQITAVCGFYCARKRTAC